MVPMSTAQHSHMTLIFGQQHSWRQEDRKTIGLHSLLSQAPEREKTTHPKKPAITPNPSLTQHSNSSCYPGYRPLSINYTPVWHSQEVPTLTLPLVSDCIGTELLLNASFPFLSLDFALILWMVIESVICM